MIGKLPPKLIKCRVSEQRKNSGEILEKNFGSGEKCKMGRLGRKMLGHSLGICIKHLEMEIFIVEMCEIGRQGMMAAENNSLVVVA